MATSTGWTTIRTFSSTTVEAATSAPTAASMVDVPNMPSRYVEVRSRADGETDAITTTATGTVTAVEITIWRQYGGAGDEAKIDPIGTLDLSVTSNAGDPAIPVQFEVWGAGKFYATASAFTGGIAPTVSGIIEARLVGGE